jgi:hypothetical protein
MLFRETVAVYCENHTEQVNSLRMQNTKILNAEVVHIVTIMLEMVTDS